MLLIFILLICAVYVVIMLTVHGIRKVRMKKWYAQFEPSTEECDVERDRAQEKTQLARLKEYLDSGLITKEEYKARRKELLKE